MRTVWIVQPYVPTYRVPFFERLTSTLALSGITLRIAAGTPAGTQAARGDSTSPEWVTPIDMRQRGPAVLTHTWHLVRGADVVIYPHMGSWLELNRALVSRPFREVPRIGVWGHIASYVGKANPIDAAIERWQLRKSDHVFAYTSGGAAFASSVGVPDRSITVLNNTVDTDELELAIDSLTVREIAEFAAKHGLTTTPAVAYLGGLDSSKRVELLVQTLDLLWERRPDLKVLVGGTGEDAGMLSPAQSRGQAVLLGYVGAREKALIAKTASALVNPGRIGLVAVDALIMKLPIVTVSGNLHAPELEYLTEGETMFTVPPNGHSLSQKVVAIADHHLLPSFGSPVPRIGDFVAQFRRGILAMIGP